MRCRGRSNAPLPRMEIAALPKAFWAGFGQVLGRFWSGAWLMVGQGEPVFHGSTWRGSRKSQMHLSRHWSLDPWAPRLACWKVSRLQKGKSLRRDDDPQWQAYLVTGLEITKYRQNTRTSVKFYGDDVLPCSLLVGFIVWIQRIE